MLCLEGLTSELCGVCDAERHMEAIANQFDIRIDVCLMYSLMVNATASPHGM